MSTLTKREALGFIGKEKLHVLGHLVALYPDLIVTGSISLMYHGLVRRPVNDLDVVVMRSDFKANPPRSLVAEGLKVVETACEEDYDDEDAEDHVRYTIEGVDVCFFIQDNADDWKEQLQAGVHPYDRIHDESRVWLSFCNPKVIIGAKRSYIEDLRSKAESRKREGKLQSMKQLLTSYEYSRLRKHTQDCDSYLLLYLEEEIASQLEDSNL